MKKVSVIIPVYNVVEYLDKAVESACNQSYGNLEILLVDDGSTDGSSEKCDKWKERDDRIDVIHKLNGGLSSARNAGLDAASGEYVYFLDSDDYIHPDLLSVIVPYMEDGNDMVSFGYYRVDDNEVQLSTKEYDSGEYDLFKESDRVQYLCGVLLPCRIGWESCTRIYRKEIIDRHQLRFADNRKIFAEDLYFCLCYNFFTNRVIGIREKLYYYRKRNDSIMGKDGLKCNVARMNELSKEVRKLLTADENLAYLLEIYPVIHFFIINNAITQYIRNSNTTLAEARRIIRSSVECPDEFFSELKKLGKYKQLLYTGCTKSSIRESLSYIQYIIDGSYSKLRIRNRCNYMLAKLSKYI